jgi:hypothetical protein
VEEIMRGFRKLLVLSMLWIPAVGLARKIQNDHDTSVEFLNYTTFAWGEGVSVPQPALHEQIVRAIDAELSAKFLRRIQANPDLYVVYHASATQELNFNMNNYGYSYGPQWKWGGGMRSESALQTYPKGTLVVDLWEAKSQRLIWRGVATDTADEPPAKMIQNIQKMFVLYPPSKR